LLPVDFVPVFSSGIMRDLEAMRPKTLKAMANVIALLHDGGCYETHDKRSYTKAELVEIYNRINSSPEEFQKYLTKHLSHSPEEFMSKYAISLQEILAATGMTEASLNDTLIDCNWESFELFNLPFDFKHICYKEL
jgi:hypothetical protein